MNNKKKELPVEGVYMQYIKHACMHAWAAAASKMLLLIIIGTNSSSMHY